MSSLFPVRSKRFLNFFARAENLETLTPEWLNFKIDSVNPQPVQKGTLINYKLRVRGLPLRWTSEIREWNPPTSSWISRPAARTSSGTTPTAFIAEGNNTRIIDEVLYDLPFGPLGKIAHTLMVKSDVEKIFRYREMKIRELFG